MTIESRPDLFAILDCGKCGRKFVGNIYKVVCFFDRPFCLPCVNEVNDLRVRLGANAWGIPPNAYGGSVDQ